MKIFRIVSGNNCDNKEICDISDHRFWNACGKPIRFQKAKLVIWEIILLLKK